MKISAAYAFANHISPDSISPDNVRPDHRSVASTINSFMAWPGIFAKPVPKQQQSRFREVDYRVFQHHINLVEVTHINTRAGITRIYGQNRQLVATLVLPRFDAGDTATTPSYYLVNQQPTRLSRLSVIAGLLRPLQRLTQRCARLMSRPQARKVIAPRSILPGKIPAPRTRARRNCKPAMAAAVRVPVWNTLRLTA